MFALWWHGWSPKVWQIQASTHWWDRQGPWSQAKSGERLESAHVQVDTLPSEPALKCWATTLLKQTGPVVCVCVCVCVCVYVCTALSGPPQRFIIEDQILSRTELSHEPLEDTEGCVVKKQCQPWLLLPILAQWFTIDCSLPSHARKNNWHMGHNTQISVQHIPLPFGWVAYLLFPFRQKANDNTFSLSVFDTKCMAACVFNSDVLLYTWF